MTVPALERPPRVLTACLFAGALCLMLFFQVGWALTNWGSIAVQKEIHKALDGDALKRAGLQFDDVIGWLRWGLMALAVVAAIGVIFAIYTAMGHQASRIILTVICVLASVAFLGLGIFGLIPAAFSVWCATLLWTPEARRWFAFKNGKYVAPVAVPVEAIAAGGFETPRASATQSASGEPGYQASATQPASPTKMPRSVLTAGLIAGLGSALVGFICAINVLFYALSKRDYLNLMNESPLITDAIKSTGRSAEQLASFIFLACSVCVVLALFGIVFAAATMLRQRWGRTGLLVLSVATALISLFVPPLGFVMTGLAVATFIFLRRPESHAWFVRDK